MKTRKELKEEYKKLKPRMGVFQIRNIESNRVFIDCSTDMLSKWNRHRTELNFGKHQNAELLNDWKEKGEDGFAFEILSILTEIDADSPDYRKELKLMQTMVVEEMSDPYFY